MASSSFSTRIISPKSRQAAPAISAVASVESCRSISSGMASASARDVVIIVAGEVGPCSACPSKSVTTISASEVWSAITRISVGPANKSIPTRPYS